MNTKSDNQPIIKPKTIGIITISLLVIIIGISVYFIIENMKRSVSLRFLIAPSSATITLDNQSFENSNFYKYYPGDYHLTISRDGFKTYETDITLLPDDTLEFTYSLDILPGNEDFYQTHPGEAYALETIWANQMIVDSSIVSEKYPLLSVLPINVEYYIQNSRYVHYTISFRINNPEDVTILISDYSGGSHDFALDRIRTEGYNPDDYTIEYIDLSENYTGTDNFQ